VITSQAGAAIAAPELREWIAKPASLLLEHPRVEENMAMCVHD